MAHVDDILNTDPVGNNVEGGFGKSEATSTGGSSFRHVQVVVLALALLATLPGLVGLKALSTATVIFILLSIFDGERKHPIYLQEQPVHNLKATEVFVRPKLRRISKDHLGFPGMNFSESLLMNILGTKFWKSMLSMSIFGGLMIFQVTFFVDHIYAAIALGVFAKFIFQNLAHWYKHVRCDQSEVDLQQRSRKCSENLFFQRGLEVKVHPYRKGVRTWTARHSLGWFMDRGMTTTGMDLIPFMHDLLTWAIEYKFIAAVRMAHFDLQRFFRRSIDCTAHKTFMAIMNTSLACYVDLKNEELVMYDTCLPHNGIDVRWWHKITLEMNFNTREVGVMRMWPGTEADTCEVLVIDSQPEIDAILYAMGALKAHAMTHVLANGVGDVDPAEWHSADTSHVVTQGFNNGAMFSADVTLGNEVTPYWFGVVLGNNCCKEGLPMHNSLKGEKVGDCSTLHKLAAACRKALAETIPEVHHHKREAIVIATVMHAGDHWYMDKFASEHAASEVLNSSLLAVRNSLQKPMHYRSRDVMMKDRVESDPVCAALYNACAKIDSEFADEALSVGILV